MRALFTQLEAIEQTSGSNAKKALLKELCKNKQHKEILHMALDPLFPMYIGKEFKAEPYNPECDEHDCASMVMVMKNLHEGVIDRGGPAHETINGVIGSFEPHDGSTDQAMKWIPRLLSKDLQIGISWESYTKVIGEKKFAVMLAKDIKKIKNLEKKFEFPVYVQPKLDGYRAFSNVEGEGELRSRNGKLYKNFPEIVEALEESCPDHLMLDGEIMSDDFQAMQKTAFRQDGESVGDVVYHVFDVVTREEWDNREGTFTFEERHDSLCALIEHHPLLKTVETLKCDNWEEVYTIHERFLKEGYEGTMVRANKPYQFKRTDYLAKIKEMLSMDCEVIDVIEGRNSLVGSMGHLVVKQENDVECGVGSGFTQACRQEIFDQEDMFVGRIAEIKYQELTKDGVMRFPVFVRWRDDK